WDQAESRSLAQEAVPRDVTRRAVGDGVFQIPPQPRRRAWRTDRALGGHSFVRALQSRDIDLLHVHHCGECALRLVGLFVEKKLVDHRGNDLPREAKFVFEPTAYLCARIAAGRELGPVVVDLALVLAIDLERDGLVELEIRTAVECGEWLSIESELDCHHRSGWFVVLLVPGFAVVRDFADARVLEDAGVVARGVLGLCVEPEAGTDSLCDGHETLLETGFAELTRKPCQRNRRGFGTACRIGEISSDLGLRRHEPSRQSP